MKKTSSLITQSSVWGGVGGEPLKPNHTQVLARLQHSNTQWSPLQQSSTWGSAPSPPPACCQSSLLFLLLLLELLNGIHLSSGAHLAHGGGVFALHHQLIGHLIVFLQRNRKGKKKALMRKATQTGKNVLQRQKSVTETIVVLILQHLIRSRIW